MLIGIASPTKAKCHSRDEALARELRVGGRHRTLVRPELEADRSAGRRKVRLEVSVESRVVEARRRDRRITEADDVRLVVAAERVVSAVSKLRGNETSLRYSSMAPREPPELVSIAKYAFLP